MSLVKKTPAEIWDFLVGLKQTTESGFLRMESRFTELDARIDRLEHRLETRIDAVERRVVRIDDRLAGLEDLTIRQRLDNHEGRIANLEHRTI
jgi:hypothetical protein